MQRGIMVKFLAKGQNGTFILGLGFSAMNISKLMDNQPISFHLEDLQKELPEVDFKKTEILIFYGSTEDEIVNAVKSFMAPDMKIKVEEN